MEKVREGKELHVHTEFLETASVQTRCTYIFKQCRPQLRLHNTCTYHDFDILLCSMRAPKFCTATSCVRGRAVQCIIHV